MKGHLFDPHELVFIVRWERRRRGLKYSDKALEALLGIAAPTIQRIRKRSRHQHREIAIHTLWLGASQESEFPWSLEAESQLHFMRESIRDEGVRSIDTFNSYGFSGRVSLEIVRKCHQDDRLDLTKDEAGHLLIAYYWFLSIIHESNSAEYRENVEDIELVEDFLDRYLRSIEPNAWATILRFKVAHNLFGRHWSAAPGEERERFRREVEDRGYIGCMMEYSEVVEGDRAALHNALAVASRLNMEDYFCELGRRYTKAGKYETMEEFEKAIAAEYEDGNSDDAQDFDRFLDWARPKWKTFLDGPTPMAKDLQGFFKWVSSAEKPRNRRAQSR